MKQPFTREEEEEECGCFSSVFLFFATYLPRLEKGAKEHFLVLGPKLFLKEIKG